MLQIEIKSFVDWRNINRLLSLVWSFWLLWPVSSKNYLALLFLFLIRPLLATTMEAVELFPGSIWALFALGAFRSFEVVIHIQEFCLKGAGLSIVKRSYCIWFFWFDLFNSSCRSHFMSAHLVFLGSMLPIYWVWLDCRLLPYLFDNRSICLLDCREIGNKCGNVLYLVTICFLVLLFLLNFNSKWRLSFVSPEVNAALILYFMFDRRAQLATNSRVIFHKLQLLSLLLNCHIWNWGTVSLWSYDCGPCFGSEMLLCGHTPLFRIVKLILF